MNANVVAFPVKETPHVSGPATCFQCAHKWTAVAPIGVVWLQCPACSSEKGHHDFTCCYPDIEVYTCNCGNQLWYMAKDGSYCPNCGNWA